MEENYIEKYQSLIFDISKFGEDDMMDRRWYDENYYSETLIKLQKTFPNVDFSKEDLAMKLRKLSMKKSHNDFVIEDLGDNHYGHSFYETHGHNRTKEETKQYNDAKDNKEKIDEEYTDAFSGFFRACEILNGDKEEGTYDIEKDAFEAMYKHEFKLRPKNTMLNSFYETYKKLNDEKKINTELAKKNEVLQQQIEEKTTENTELVETNTELTETNTELTKKVSKLQKMLSKTLEFCNKVKSSILGRFFFRKHLKALPSPEETKDTDEKLDEAEEKDVAQEPVETAEKDVGEDLNKNEEKDDIER